MQERMPLRIYDGKMAVFLGRDDRRSRPRVHVRVGEFEVALTAADWEALPEWREPEATPIDPVRP